MIEVKARLASRINYEEFEREIIKRIKVEGKRGSHERGRWHNRR